VFISGIGYPALACAPASDPLALEIQTARSAQNHRPPRKPSSRGGQSPQEDTKRLNIRQLTDVLRCNLQQHFQRKTPSRLAEEPMNTMAPTRPTELYQRRIRLTREPAAAAEARSQVRVALRDWKVPVDPDIAILLTSDLVTNAIVHGEGDTVTLAIRCSRGHLRIDVYDKSRYGPVGVDAGTGRGLVLVAALSADWGSFRTPAGKATYFTLAFHPPSGGDRVAAAD
jgi:hypothetical protein